MFNDYIEDDGEKLLDNSEEYNKYDVIILEGILDKGEKISLEFNYSLFFYKNNKIIKEISYYNIIAWYYSKTKKKFGIKYKLKNNSFKLIIFKCPNSDLLIDEMRKNIREIRDLYECDYEEIQSFLK